MHQPSSTQARDTSPLRLATAPVNWNNNDIPGWRPPVPFPEILDRAHDAGYDAIEYDVGFGSNPDVLNSETLSRDMTWCGCYQWVDFLDSANLDAAITHLAPLFELLHEIDCRHLIVADSLRPHRVALAGRVPTNGSASLDDDAVARLADGVHRLADTAEGFNISVHYHNHVGSWIEAPYELDALLRRLDRSRVSLCFDTGHYAYGGGDPATFIRCHIDAIGYLHLKDVDTRAVANARQRELSFIDALKEYVFSPLGEGAADIPTILRTLVDADFSGWTVVEQDTCEGDATAIARANRDFIVNWLADTPSTEPSGRTAS